MTLYVLRQRLLAASVFACFALFPVAANAVPVAEGGDEISNEQPTPEGQDVVRQEETPPVVVDRSGKTDFIQISGGSSLSSGDQVTHKPKSSLLSLYREWKAEREAAPKPQPKVDVAALAPLFIIESAGVVIVPAACGNQTVPLLPEVNLSCADVPLY